MPDFRIDPELRIRASPPIVLCRTTEAVDFIRKVALSTPDRAWQDVLQSFEAARDEWSAMEAVVDLELLLEAGGLLIEEGDSLRFSLWARSVSRRRMRAMEIEGTTFGTITRGSTFGSMCLDRLNCSPFAVSCGGLSAQPGLAIAF